MGSTILQSSPAAVGVLRSVSTVLLEQQRGVVKYSACFYLTHHPTINRLSTRPANTNESQEVGVVIREEEEHVVVGGNRSHTAPSSKSFEPLTSMCVPYAAVDYRTLPALLSWY